MRSIVQPTLRPLFDTRAFGDTLLDIARAIGGCGRGALPAGSFRGVVEAAWAGHRLARGAPARRRVRERRRRRRPGIAEGVARLEFKEPQLEGDGGFVLLAVPSPLLGDGRGANLPLLQETPDPITKIAWQSWAEISTSAADALGVEPGDLLAIETPYGKVEVPAWPRGGIRDDVVAVAIGQGHTVGRYARSTTAGSERRLPGRRARRERERRCCRALTDESGGRAWLAAKASVTAAGGHQRLPFAQGTDNKRGRQLGERDLAGGARRRREPVGRERGAGPRPARPRRRDRARAKARRRAAQRAHGGGTRRTRCGAVRPGRRLHARRPYRWGMTIDLDQLHRLQRLHRRVLRREQHPDASARTGSLRSRGR